MSLEKQKDKQVSHHPRAKEVTQVSQLINQSQSSGLCSLSDIENSAIHSQDF